MSLLKLTPEGDRLRRVAKAHAAGEIATPEYRRMRAQVIERFGAGLVPSLGDVTERRPPHEVSTAPLEVTARAPRPPARGAAPREVQEAQRESLPESSRRKLLLRWYIGGAALLAFALWVAASYAEASMIPPVRERDPNPATSPRIAVTSVFIRNFAAAPEGSISETEVEDFLRERLAALSRAAGPSSHGFTAAELDEIGRLLDVQGAHSDRPLTGRHAAELTDLIHSQKARRGVSIVALEGLAQEVSMFYRERGFPLAVAYLPSQEPKAGSVAIEVQLGVLESVQLIGASGYPAALIERAFADQLGRPVTRAIESTLYLVNDLPGIDAVASFSAGEEVGATRLDLEAKGERKYRGEVRIDNHGDDATGAGRALLRGDWLSPSRRGDVLSGWLVRSFDPDNTVYGGLEYAAPIGDLRTRLIGRVAYDAFDWTELGLDEEGKSSAAAFGARHSLARSRLWSSLLDGMLTVERLELDRSSGGEILDQDLAYASLAWEAVRRFDERLTSLTGRLQLDGGAIGDGEFPGQSGSLLRLGVSGGVWRLVDLPFFDDPQRIGARLRAQLSNSALPGTLQLGLGGATRVRGFDAGTFSVDDGVAVSFESRLRPWAPEYGELVLFADAAYGERRQEFGGDVSAHLASAGIGWDVDVLERLRAELRLAAPLVSRDSEGTLPDEGYQLIWSLRYAP